MDDYLAAQGLILDRLRDRLPDIPVKATWGLSELQDSPDQPTGVWVTPEGDSPGEAIHGNTQHQQKVDQVWGVLVVVRDPEGEAGVLISRVIKALAGWKPGTGFSPLRRVKSQFKAEQAPQGSFYYPLAFSTSFVFKTE